MTQYLYPQNLKAKANLWFWGLRDFAILSIAALLSVAAIINLGILFPAALTLGYGFLSIRIGDTTVMDISYLRIRLKFFPNQDTGLSISMNKLDSSKKPRYQRRKAQAKVACAFLL